MATKTLTYTEAAQAILGIDPLSDARITLGWQTINGHRVPVLRISGRSTVRYKERAKPLGTIIGRSGDWHGRMLTELGVEINIIRNVGEV